jgi:hypothetical protein
MEEVAGDNPENKILCFIIKMNPAFIFIIIIALVAAYFIFFKKDKSKTETYVKCVNDTKTKNKFGLLGIPCFAMGLSLEETTDYINNLNDFMKGRKSEISTAEEQTVKDLIKVTKKVNFTEQESTTNTEFALKSMPFINDWDGIQKNFTVAINSTPAKYIAPADVKVVISALEKKIFNTYNYLKNCYEYMDKETKISDPVASTIATMVSLYIYYNNILNFIQTH